MPDFRPFLRAALFLRRSGVALGLPLLLMAMPFSMARAQEWQVISLPQDLGIVQDVRGLALDANGSLYVPDFSGNRILKRDPNGVWTLLAEQGAEPGQVQQPDGVAVGTDGSLYVADFDNDRVQKRDPNGVWSVLAAKGSQPGGVKLPRAVAVAGDGSLYVADYGNHRVQMRDPAGTWTVLTTPLEEFETPTEPNQVSQPIGLALAPDGSLYVADESTSRITKRDPAGVWTEAMPNSQQFEPPLGKVGLPKGVAVDADGNLYVADDSGPPVTKRTPDGTWSVAATRDSDEKPGDVGEPTAIAVGGGSLYVMDSGKQRILKRDPAGVWTPVSRTRQESTLGSVWFPSGVEVDANDTLYVADGGNRRILKWNAGNWSLEFPDADDPKIGPYALAFGPDGSLYLPQTGSIRKRDPAGVWTTLAADGVGLGEVDSTSDVAVGPDGSLYVAEDVDGNQRVQKRDPAGVWTRLDVPGGGGAETPGDVLSPSGLAVGPDGALYVADSDLNNIQKRDANGVWTLLEAEYGVKAGQVKSPSGLAFGPDGSLYVADTTNNRIQRRDSAGVWTIFSVPTLNEVAPPPGIGIGEFDHPGSVAVDSHGNVYVADTNNHRIQRFGAALPQFQPGDVNRDGKRDVADAVLILRILVTLYQPDAEQQALSNVNGDATTDIADAVALLRIITGL